VKTAQPAGISCLLSLNNNYAYNLPAKFLITRKNEVAIIKGLQFPQPSWWSPSG